MGKLYSLSGAPIFLHERKKDVRPAFGNLETIDRISAHVEKHVGPVSMVYHEIISDLVHVDIHVVEPSEERPFYMLVTSGMSDMPMNVPKGLEAFRYAELMLCLPPDWKLGRRDLEREENYWPIRWLKRMARFPHEYDTYLFAGHTVPNGDPPKPFASNTKLCCMLVWMPVMVRDPRSFFELKMSEGKMVYFFSLIPIYKEEMNFKLRNGLDPLINLFVKHGVSELVDIFRRNVCA
jgi:hypothetical protein